MTPSFAYCITCVPTLGDMLAPFAAAAAALWLARRQGVRRTG